MCVGFYWVCCCCCSRYSLSTQRKTHFFAENIVWKHPQFLTYVVNSTLIHSVGERFAVHYRGRMEMSHISSNCCCHFLVILMTLATLSQASSQAANVLKTATFLSPRFELEPGSVANKNYYNIDFPRGHIAVKRFDAEVVDEAGHPVSLHETYMHHWLVVRSYIRKGVGNPRKYNSPASGFDQSDFIMVENSGICGNALGQYFGLGSETRKTDTHVPDPYGIEVGKVEEIPEGYEEGWLLNVHAIDTRGAVDKLGCTECRCDLYNVTVDDYGRAIERDYIGGLRCCGDGTRCRVKQGFENGGKRGLYLKYIVTYVEWDDSSPIVPVKIYIIDVTDDWGKMDGTTKVSSQGHSCKIEFNVDSCPANLDKENCIHTQSAISSLPNGGDVIYAVSHQHTGGVGSALYGEDGRIICSSHPIYGDGNEAGNEDGYIVGMTTCYPRPGSVKIAKGETLTIVSNYSSTQSHTGVMGLFYILVAEPLHNSKSALHEAHRNRNFSLRLQL